MNSLYQLHDPKHNGYYLIDANACTLSVKHEGTHKQTRLKKYAAEILATLFNHHPKPVSYQDIQTILEKHRIVCPDETRMHRKISELRVLLCTWHAPFKGLIMNARQHGYHLPLHLQDPSERTVSVHLQTPAANDMLHTLMFLTNESLALSRTCTITKSHQGYVLDTRHAAQRIDDLLTHFEKVVDTTPTMLQLHPHDFSKIRLDQSFATLKTYIGLARISAFSITKEKWLEWHEIEVNEIINRIIEQLKHLSA